MLLKWPSFEIPLLFLGRRTLQIIVTVLAPPRMLVVSIAMQIYPQFLLRIVFHTCISHVVQSVQGARHDVR